MLAPPPTPSSTALAPKAALGQQLTLSRVPTYAGEGDDVDGQCAPEQREVKGWEEEHDVGIRRLRPMQHVPERRVVAHAATRVVLQREAATEHQWGHGQEEAAPPRQ